MSPRRRAALLVVLAVVQLAVPAWMILGRERVLREGEPFRFRAVPIDPYDPFRGRYVALSLEPTVAPLPAGLEVARGEPVYVPLAVDAEGFATFGPVATKPPAAGAYLELDAGYPSEGGLSVDLPFARYYLRDDLAPAAETAFWRLAGDEDSPPSWLDVHVLEGRGVAAQLWVAGVRAEEVATGALDESPR